MSVLVDSDSDILKRRSTSTFNHLVTVIRHNDFWGRGFWGRVSKVCLAPSIRNFHNPITSAGGGSAGSAWSRRHETETNILKLKIDGWNWNTTYLFGILNFILSAANC